MTKVYKITLWLESLTKINEYRMRIYEFEAEEKKKTYEFWDGRIRKYKKEKIGIIDTGYIEDSYKFINYHVYCLEDQIEECKDKLIDRVTKKLNERIETTDKLKSLLDKGFSIEYVEERD